MASSSKCPVCGTPVRAENLSRHLQSVHPREVKSDMVREAERKATAKRPPPAPVITTGSVWKVALVVVLVGLIAGGAYVVATIPASPYNETTPVTEMCIQHSQTFARHDHAFLHIMISGSAYTIPANTGITPTCMRPLHTHDTTGEMHIESPVRHEFMLGDFFLVWGQPFNANQILSYRAGPGTGHTLTMTVNGVQNSQFENFVLPHTPDPNNTVIALTYQ